MVAPPKENRPVKKQQGMFAETAAQTQAKRDDGTPDTRDLEEVDAGGIKKHIYERDKADFFFIFAVVSKSVRSRSTLNEYNECEGRRYR